MIFYTGSYTQKGAPAANPVGTGISCFDLDENRGKVRFLHSTEQRNPSYLVVSADKRFLYAAEEMYEDLAPRIYAYQISDSGKLNLINSQELAGDYACHLAIVANQLVVANYVSGNVLSYPIRNDGGLECFSQIIQHEGKGPNVERQEQAHAHMVYACKDDQMFVVDLGIDKALAYKFFNAINKWEALSGCDIPMPAGSGPRHMVMDKNERYAYVISELNGEVFVFRARANKFEPVQKLSYLPKDFMGNFGGAAIRMHPNGKFLYTSCRGADVITVFWINDAEGTLELINVFSSEGKTPRDFNISPSGNWFIAANQDSDELLVFKLNQEDGTLIKHSSISTGTPANICWR
jgi:6-phosphogluconolactonase